MFHVPPSTTACWPPLSPHPQTWSHASVRQNATPYRAEQPKGSPCVGPVKPPLSVLVVDDTRSSRYFVRCLLERWGMQVRTAVDGLDAWDQLHQSRFDMVISDIEMPRWSGIDLLGSLRKSSVPFLRRMPVVLVSSLGVNVIVRKASHWNDVYYVERPIEPAELSDMMRLATLAS